MHGVVGFAAGGVDGGDDEVFEHGDVAAAAEAAEGAMVSFSNSFLPFMRAVTAPPPESASTMVAARRCSICSRMAVAWESMSCILEMSMGDPFTLGRHLLMSGLTLGTRRRRASLTLWTKRSG